MKIIVYMNLWGSLCVRRVPGGKIFFGSIPGGKFCKLALHCCCAGGWGSCWWSCWGNCCCWGCCRDIFRKVVYSGVWSRWPVKKNIMSSTSYDSHNNCSSLVRSEKCTLCLYNLRQMSNSLFCKSIVTKLMVWCSCNSLVNDLVKGLLTGCDTDGWFDTDGFAPELVGFEVAFGGAMLLKSSSASLKFLCSDASKWKCLMCLTFNLLILLFLHLILMLVVDTCTTSAGPNHLGASFRFLPLKSCSAKRTKSPMPLPVLYLCFDVCIFYIHSCAFNYYISIR